MFEKIIDVRVSSGKRHCLMHIIVMSVCGILNKCIDYVNCLEEFEELLFEVMSQIYKIVIGNFCKKIFTLFIFPELLTSSSK